MAEQLYNEVTTQWGIYHEFLTAPMMRVYLTWGQPERALSIADEALERGAQADVWMVSAQIQGLATLARLEEAETKLDAFITKKTTATATATSVHVLQRLYHALALGHAQQGNLDQVRRIYAKMRANLKLSVPLPDSWTAHMIAAAHRNSISDVCAVKQELEEDGYLLGDQNYAIALLVFAKQGNLMLAQQWFDQIVASEKNEHKEKQITMTRHIITAMLQAYTRSDHSDKGYLFWCDMRAKYSNDINSPTRIDNALLSVLLDMSGRGLGVKETETIWHMATTSDRVRVNGNNGAALVEAYMRHGELEKAVNTMEQYRNDPAMRGMGVMLSGLRTRCKEQERHDLISKLDTRSQ
ncbi:hypothetical protein BDF22DRAFT_175147 [Syncephalis plumigaleata]|nr:hypothetical protein BDF22DRAFT_175147 [Syncephalis plumigaleata]